MIVLSTQDMASLLPMPKAIELVSTALIAASSGKANLPLRHAIDVGAPNMLGIMPGTMDEPDCYGGETDKPLSQQSSQRTFLTLRADGFV